MCDWINENEETLFVASLRRLETVKIAFFFKTAKFVLLLTKLIEESFFRFNGLFTQA